MEASSKTWKDSLLEGFRKIEELEFRKQRGREKMVEFIKNEQYDFYLMLESELKKMDVETEDLWGSIKVTRERWKIERAIHKEKKPERQETQQPNSEKTAQKVSLH
jgi:hypothetical protein